MYHPIPYLRDVYSQWILGVRTRGMLPYSAWNFSQLWPSCGTTRARRTQHTYNTPSQDKPATKIWSSNHVCSAPHVHAHKRTYICK